MKKIGREPRFLPNVMEAIASLKEKNGSTQRHIVDHIAHILKRKKDGSRNITVQVRRALEHGLHTGLIKQRSGKFTLGLDKRDYAVFRRFRQITDPSSDCNACKRGRRGRRGKRGRSRRGRSRRRGKKRGRRGRRRPVSQDDDEMTDGSESGRSITDGTPEPVDRSRRRKRRKGRKSRRRGRRGRRRASHNETNSESSDVGHKDSNSGIPPEKRRSDQDKTEYQSKTAPNNNHNCDRLEERNPQERIHNHDEEDLVDCGNPECLCNIKQENDSPRCMSRDNDYYDNSYLN